MGRTHGQKRCAGRSWRGIVRPTASTARSNARRARQRSLKDDDEVLAALEDAGIDRERLLSVDGEKVDEALEVVSLPESAVYETDESEYVRKAEVDKERKETRLQG